MSSPNTHIRHKLTSAALRCGVLWLWLLAGQVHASPCETERVVITGTPPESLLPRARAFAAEKKYGRARFVYELMLAQKVEEREASLGLARVDAWEHCYEGAEAKYRSWLSGMPRDVEARAGLIDVLLWMERWDDAQRELDAGLQADPEAMELLLRRAILYFRRGDHEAALRATEEALKNAPTDAELRAMRERLFFNQVRAYLRLDRYPGEYPDVHSAGLSYWRRLYDVELNLDVLLVERSGGALPKSIFDAQYTAGASYHFGPLATVGVVGGFGAPARALPRWLGRVWLYSQWTSAWSGTLSYALWDYTAHKTAHILTPILTFTPSDLLSFEARYYGTWLVLHQPGPDRQKFVSTIALRGAAQLLADLRLGLSYTYGAQLDQVGVSDIISMHSHVLAVFADYRLNHAWGIQPFLSGERRVQSERSLWIVSFELGSYVRW